MPYSIIVSHYSGGALVPDGGVKQVSEDLNELIVPYLTQYVCQISQANFSGWQTEIVWTEENPLNLPIGVLRNNAHPRLQCAFLLDEKYIQIDPSWWSEHLTPENQRILACVADMLLDRDYLVELGGLEYRTPACRCWSWFGGQKCYDVDLEIFRACRQIALEKIITEEISPRTSFTEDPPSTCSSQKE